MSDGDSGGKRPLIGISTYREQARWGYWDVPAVLLPATYADAVAECGGEPVLLPTGAISAAVVARLDGLVLAGGADVDPARYGQSPGPHTTVVRPERDEAELAVLAAALERDLPLLADLPGHAAAQRPPRRRPGAAPARRPDGRGAPRRPGRVRAARGHDGAGHRAGRAARARPRRRTATTTRR